jgi:hypothetical protein
MALWKPNEKVGKNESIGRRLFQRQGLKGAKDQRRPDRTFELYHFEETRDREVSVDRLGATSIDGKVKAYLNPRGHYAATRLHKAEFRGWAVTKAKELQLPPNSFQISASPIAAHDGEPLSDNSFHAHIETPERYNPRDMAVMLKYIFEENYHLERSVPSDKKQGFLTGITNWFGARWRSLFRP